MSPDRGRAPLPPPLPLDVPFLPDAAYLEFLAAHQARLLALHVPLFLPQVPDARPRELTLTPRRLAELLALCPGPRKYALINSRFHAPEAYGAPEFLGPLLAALETLLEAGQLTGLIYCDHYLLQALSDAAPGLCGALEAVPGVNCGLDNPGKIFWHLEYIAQTRFRQPRKLNLDRELNRRLPELERLGQTLRERLSELQLVLLANEGCLPHCPFKQAHDAHLALSGLQGLAAPQLSLNRERGCTRLFFEKPELLFTAPFIRPEDQRAYAPLVDGIKVCGRSRGPEVMRALVTAYLEERFAGNLLWLNDSQEGLSGRLYVDNTALPPNFLALVGDCTLDCRACGSCRELAQRHVQRLAPHLPDMASRETPPGP